MKRALVVLVVFSGLFMSCSKIDRPGLESDIKKFDAKFVDHFPKGHNGVPLVEIFSYPDKKLKVNMGVFLIARLEVGEDIDSLIKISASKAINIVAHNDSCNLILPVRHLLSIEKPVILPCKNGDLIPVPSFDGVLYDLDSDSMKYLPEDYKLYLLDYKHGKFIDKNMLMKEGVMPDSWTHGYSKGVAISRDKEEAIYWIEIW